MRRSFQVLEEAIRNNQDLVLDSTLHPKLLKHDVLLLAVASDKLAVITLRAMLNLLSLKRGERSERRLSSVAREIGAGVYAERSYEEHRGNHRNLAALLLPRNRNPNAKRRAADLALSAESNWSGDDRGLRLGLELLNIALKHVVFNGEPAFRVMGTTGILSITDDARQWIESRAEYYEKWARPIYTPMIVPPLAWKGLEGGGYLAIKNLQLIKRGRSHTSRNVLEGAALERVLGAVNALQNTRWRINDRIYHIMAQAWERGYPFPGTPLQLQDLPARLPTDTPRDQLLRHKGERASIHQQNVIAAGNRRFLALRLQCCSSLLKYAGFYFPHQLDSRGRIYPIPQILHPQADDVGRALLMFDLGKPLGIHGARWLRVHLANLFGVGKTKTFSERLTWVAQYEEQILASAHVPLSRDQLWTKAKHPWAFLAACVEWAQYRNDGPECLSHLPVSMDGTCNGLQHLSALGCDEVTARATNVTPAPRPQDIYQQVAERAQLRVSADQMAGIVEAHSWQSLDRALVKRATMTTPYGVTLRGIRDQLIEHCRALGPSRNPREDTWKRSDYLAHVLQDSIANTIVKSMELMEWLKTIARTLARKDRPLIWRLPTGFIVIHEYRKRKERRIVTTDRTLVIYDNDPHAPIDIRKQVNAIVPNLVHSLDAAHMMLTVLQLTELGLTDFAMVHDSYGVHASDVDILNTTLRKSFIHLYREPILHRFIEEQRAANPDLASVLVQPPAGGSLDIEQVVRSKYFCA